MIIATSTRVRSEDTNLKNFNDCLYLYSSGGEYDISIVEHNGRSGVLPVANATIDLIRTSCFSKSRPYARLALQFSEGINKDFMDSMLFEFHINKTGNFWEVVDIELSFVPVGQWPEDLPKSVKLLPDDLYAGNGFSYSCNNLILKKRPSNKDKHDKTVEYRISFSRFQLQPFKNQLTVFAQSYDCSVWLTLPLIMGFILVLFITLTVIIVIYLMIELGAQTKDLKFSKQGGMLMNQAQLESTKN